MLQTVRHLLLCLCCLPGLAAAADIWRAIGEDGVPRYASSKLDSSYSLFLRDDAPPAGEAAKSTMPAARRNLLLRWLPTIEKLSSKHGVELALVLAIIDVESRFNPSATSPKGAAGLMQIMPALAARYGVRNRYDVQQNLEAGILYLKDLHKIHQGNIPLMLASYNAGEHAVARHGKRLPPYRETMLYVPQVMASLAAARELAATANGVVAVP
ncbi:lytic transglycosylase domain-containing protein [Massilia sp. W12]|uniref:lytic transglycosylase domain-containing protein n=1 Tax=Massilia sp. W12 TaxID=3126507 RepID=UPI0030CD2E54